MLVQHGVDRARLTKLIPKQKAARGKPGAPKKWTDDDYRVMLRMYEHGKAVLEQRGRCVTDVEALVVAFDEQYRPQGWTVREVRYVAHKIAKRLTDARKAIRK